MIADAPSAIASSSPVARIDELVVVVPANDEESLIGACLVALSRSVARAAELAASGAPVVRVVVVLDACTDGTAGIVGAHPWVSVVEVEFRNVGAARASGVRFALDTAEAGPARVWIANTDADTRVPEGWVLQQLALAAAGNELALGSIRPDPRDLTLEQYHAWERRNESEIAGKRDRIHGANLGVRGDAYLAVGGFRPLPVGEDVDLVTRLRTGGARTIASDACWVETSARTVGRTPGGFAEYVRRFY